jgi:hypothetical protein
VRGLNRVHQFDKVEIVRIEKPENSYAVLEEMVEHVKGLLRALELPYRQLLLCGGDMGFASAMTYDMEVYSAAQTPLAGGELHQQLRDLPEQPDEAALPGRGQEAPFGTHLEWKCAGLGTYRGRTLGEQPDTGWDPDTEGAATLHGHVDDHQMNRSTLFLALAALTFGVLATGCQRTTSPQHVTTLDSLLTSTNGALLTLRELDPSRYDLLDSAYHALLPSFLERLEDTLRPERGRPAGGPVPGVPIRGTNG